MDNQEVKLSQKNESPKDSNDVVKEGEIYGPSREEVAGALQHTDIPQKTKNYVTFFFTNMNAELRFLYSTADDDNGNMLIAEKLRDRFDRFYVLVCPNAQIVKGQDGKNFNNSEILKVLRETEAKTLMKDITVWAMEREAASVLSFEHHGVLQTLARVGGSKTRLEHAIEKIREAETATKKTAE